MSLKKLLSMLLMLTLTFTVFTACEEDPTDPEDPTNTPLPVSEVYAGQVAANTIQFQWTASPSADSTWFAGYRVTVTGGSTSVDTVLGKDASSYNFSNATLSTVYSFTVVAVSNENTSSASKTITWATATHFTTDDTRNPINVYVKEASGAGSGLCIYNATLLSPTVHLVASASNWNLALGSKTNLIFGTASKDKSAVDYGVAGTPTDAEITGVIIKDFTTTDPAQMLSATLHAEDLSKLTFSKKYIDLLTDPDAQAAVNGIGLFARINGHYAKVIIIKKNGSFLQDANAARPYVQVLISYQTTSGVPYAKIIANK